jgi:hypothetical protein
VREGVQLLRRLGYGVGRRRLVGNICEDTRIVDKDLADRSQPQDRQEWTSSIHTGVVGYEFRCQVLHGERLDACTSRPRVEGPAGETGHIPSGLTGRDEDGDGSNRIPGLGLPDRCSKLGQCIAHRRKSTAGHSVPINLTFTQSSKWH